MEHMNGDVLCAIDVETTGEIPAYHELVQICILPLDYNLDPVKGVMPFYINIKPESPENANPKAMRVNKLDMFKLKTEGFDKFSAIKMLKDWMYDRLKVPYNKSGFKRCKLVPVGHNYMGFDIDFVKYWFDEAGEDYFDIFSYHPRDTMIVGAYINDRLGYKTKSPKFSKIGLKSMAKALGVPYDADLHHDALYDCQLTAKVYKQLCFQNMIEIY